MSASSSLARFYDSPAVRPRSLWLLSCIVVLILLASYAFFLEEWNGCRCPTVSPLPAPIPSWETENYTDVIFGTRNLFYGPWKAKIPTSVIAGESFSMEFTCTNPERKLCPTYYTVLFHGHTRLNVDPELFGALNWTKKSVYEYAVVTARFSIQDPGRYRVYAYPELYYCSMWRNLDFPLHRAAVEGSPWDLIVLPKHTGTITHSRESFGTCSAEQIHDGRYLSIDSSSKFRDMYKHTDRSFIYAPYKCKIPARTVQQAIRSIRGVKHILFIGDSVTRNPFCQLTWKGLHGTVEDTTCDPRPGEYHRSHKFTSTTLEIDGQPTTFNFSFIWTENWNQFMGRNVEIVLAMDPQPTHVVINFGLWIPSDAENLKQHFWNALEFMQTHFNHSIKHIVLKTPASVAVDCHGKDWDPNFERPDDSLDFRYGGAKQRRAVFEIARSWIQQNPESSFRLSVIDAWLLTDSRPETTSDGRHYSADIEDVVEDRPLMGEADASLQDLIFDEFITERVLVEVRN